LQGSATGVADRGGRGKSDDMFRRETRKNLKRVRLESDLLKGKKRKNRGRNSEFARQMYYPTGEKKGKGREGQNSNTSRVVRTERRMTKKSK